MNEKSQPIIRVAGLHSGYNGLNILEDISLDIYAGEIMVILGTSGCGKTTLLKHMIGLLPAQKGSVELFGSALHQLDELEFNKLMEHIGVLFQNGALLNSVSVGENVAIPLEHHSRLPKDLMEALIQLKLQMVGLDSYYHYLPSELSGGMRKRAALARAIVLDPAILFADEPGAGLDPVTAAALDRLLLSLKEQLGMTMVVVTHEVASIKRIADRVLFLHEGKAVFIGTLKEALQSTIPEIQHFFKSNENA